MEEKIYKVLNISGEYATLVDLNSNDELFIAMALLPLSTDVGSLLRYEGFEFSEYNG